MNAMSRARRVSISILFLLTIVGFDSAFAQKAGKYEKYLTTDDITRVTGVKDVRLSESTQSSSTGHLYFSNREGKQILKVKFYRASLYKKNEATKLGLVKGEVKGIGEDAYYGPNAEMPYILSFKKGEVYVELSTIVNKNAAKDGKLQLFLTIEQLKALGKTIASRIENAKS
jgi:hypothetical protein